MKLNDGILKLQLILYSATKLYFYSAESKDNNFKDSQHVCIAVVLVYIIQWALKNKVCVLL